jgi:hypothetical protein
MPLKRELKDSLDQLRTALAADRPLSKDQRETLDALLADVSQLLEGEEEHSDESLADRLRETAEYFEDTHPDLTLAVGSVARILNRMGI